MSKGTFFNTIDMQGEELKQAQYVAGKQERIILNIFLKHKKLSPSQVHKWFREYGGGYTTPITSIRRAVTVLTDKGFLVKTEEMRLGIYDKHEHVWEYIKR